MRRTGNKRRRFLAAASVVALGLPGGAAQAEMPRPSPPLVVFISVDAFGSDLFNRWRPYFTGGLARLADEGVVYPNAYAAHGVTETCAGHATMITGAYPRRHGITANSWYDTATGEVIGCASAPASEEAGDRAGPWRLAVSTLGDWMKEADPASRVFSISGKHYAAAMMGGHRADGVFSYDMRGEFAAGGGDPAAPAVVEALNRAAGRPLRPARSPSARCQAHVRPGEETIGGELPDITDLDAVTLEGAWSLAENHQLGRNGSPDLLAISLSATDVIGHVFGASSWRMCEQMLDLDRMLGAFLDRLEAAELQAVIVLTADHGQSDTPDVLVAQGYPATYITTILTDLNSEMRSRFNLDHPPVVTGTGPHSPQGDAIQLYAVGPDERALAEPLRTQVLAAALDWLKARPEVRTAFTADELASPPAPDVPDEMSILDRMALSHAPARSGDIMVVYQPYTTMLVAMPGRIAASHGSPYDYDRRIPLIFWSSDLNPDHRHLPVSQVDVAPTLADRMSLSIDTMLDGRVLPVWP
ncbi:alkaline phosphatase family protein [Brevundimonas diminuta]|uniref:alkaline phosphatase family protein n=1 Tax=Brevundimonas diminuta TaxID=293 RepID=UPI0019059A3A|nr:alkaline phosphatase family protein [Brevundimonas diminuta]MBK1976175.1 alkaline phosphatase family protein [Brevundimonas diminuta]